MSKNRATNHKSFFTSPGIIIGLVAFLVLVLSVVVIWLYSNHRKSVTQKEITNGSQEPLPSAKTDAPTTENKPNVTTDKPVEGSTTNPTPAEKPSGATAEMTSIAQGANGDLVVQTKVTGVSTGTCTLTVTVNGQTVTKSASLIYQASFSTCAGFSVSASELTAGSASLRLSVNSDNKEVAADQKTTTIKK